MKSVTTEPNRNNWDQFCEEPQLTKAEFAEWHEMASAIREGDDALLDFITAETDGAWPKFLFGHFPIDKWSDLVEWADTGRRLRRAEIKAYQDYQGRLL